MKTIEISDFSGGLSDGTRVGIPGSFYWAKGLNYRNDPDSITANYVAAKNSGSTVADLVKWVAHDPINGNTFYYGDAGKIYKRTSGGTWSLLQTTSNSGGQGLAVYADYLYYTQDSQIGRYGSLAGSPSFTDNWQTSLNGTTEWRPIYAFMNFIAVGNGRYLAHWDDTTWTATKLTFPAGWYVHCLGEVGSYMAIGVNDAAEPASATRGLIFLWDGTSSSYNDFVSVDDGPINAVLGRQNSLYIWAGHEGNMYVYTGGVQKIKKIPFVSDKKTIYAYPGAVTNYEGLVHFGLAGGTSTTVHRGAYSWGQPNKNYPNGLNFEHPISPSITSGVNTGTAIDIGSTKAVGTNFYIGWKSSSTYGVDLVSTTVKQLSVVYESRIISLSKLGTFRGVRIYFDTLATGQTITIKYKADRQSSWQSLGSASVDVEGSVTHKFISKLGSVIKAMDIQFQATLAGTSGMPTLNKMVAYFDEMTVPIIITGKQPIDFELILSHTGQTAATLESPIIEMAKETEFSRFKLYFEALASGDTITLKYDADRTGSWTTVDTATFADDGAVTFKLLNKGFRATDLQLQILLGGTSTVPTVTKLVVESKTEGHF
tara:strand:- start:3170 stop:4963 length:1794 start_codon:yes stop_codon:yes gene_type:complete